MSLWQTQPYHLSLAFVHPFLQSLELMTDSSPLFQNWSKSPGCRDISHAFCISRSPAVLTSLSISDQKICLQPWLKVYLISHLIYFFSFFLPVQHHHLNILWQILWTRTVYQATLVSTADTAEHTQWGGHLGWESVSVAKRTETNKKKKNWFQDIWFFL